MPDEAEFKFVDTNILVYAHDTSAGDKRNHAKTIIQELWDSRTGCLSVQVLQEFYVAVTQKVSNPLEAEPATRIISDLSYWCLHTPEAKDVLGAIDLHQHYQFSFWDAMIIWSATQLGCHIILSDDLNPGQVYQGVTVVNPFKDKIRDLP